jgi:hypothetical protein
MLELNSIPVLLAHWRAVFSVHIGNDSQQTIYGQKICLPPSKTHMHLIASSLQVDISLSDALLLGQDFEDGQVLCKRFRMPRLRQRTLLKEANSYPPRRGRLQS